MSEKGLSVDAVQKVFDDFVASFNGNFDVLPYIKAKQEDIYGPNASIEKLGFPIEGAYHPAKRFITLVASNLDNEEAAKRTIRHELLGHYGLNTFTPDQKRDLLTSVLATQNEPTLKPVWDQVNKHYAQKSPLERAEEVFAFVAEKESSFLSRAWDQVRATFQKTLRASGLSDRPLTIHELRVEAQAIADGIKRGERELKTFPASDDAQFRIKDSPMDKKQSFAEKVATRLIEQLEAGTAPWQKPWEPGTGGFMPMNPTTGNRYKGINALHLMAQGYDDNRWMTYNQAQSLDAQVRKGESGTQVQYWKFEEERQKLDDAGKPVKDAEGKPVKEIVKLDSPRVFYATVFNAEQIDGLPPRQEKEPQWDAIMRAEHILSASGAKIRHDGDNRAFYRPSTDSIHLPETSQFASAANYYATALHELGHWTGHASRLDRDLSNPFGSEGYAKEELRAEISSMMLGDELGIGHDPEQHAAYVGSWVKALKEDPLEIFRAAADAEKIHNFVLAFEQQQVQQQQSTQAQIDHIHDLQNTKLLMASLEYPGTTPHQVWENLEAIAKEKGCTATLTSADNDPRNCIVTYSHNEKLLPVTTDIVVSEAKAATNLNGQRVDGTKMTADKFTQAAVLEYALETAQAMQEANYSGVVLPSLAPVSVHEQLQAIMWYAEDRDAHGHHLPYSNFERITNAATALGVTATLNRDASAPAGRGADVEYRAADGELLPVQTMINIRDGEMMTSVAGKVVRPGKQLGWPHDDIVLISDKLEDALTVKAKREERFETEAKNLQEFLGGPVENRQAYETWHQLTTTGEKFNAVPYIDKKEDGTMHVHFRRDDDYLFIDVPLQPDNTIGDVLYFQKPIDNLNIALSAATGTAKNILDTVHPVHPKVERLTAEEAVFDGEKAGDYIVRSAGGTELSSSYRDQATAQRKADTIADLALGIVFAKNDCMTHAQYEERWHRAIPETQGFAVPDAKEWNGLTHWKPLIVTETEQGRTYNEANIEQAQLLGLFVSDHDGQTQCIGTFSALADLELTRSTLEAVRQQVEIYDNKLTTPTAEVKLPSSQTSITPEQPALQSQSSSERVYLEVPFSEKEAAKAAGAKWDGQKKSWYAPEGSDLTQLEKWMPTESVNTQQTPAVKEEQQRTYLVVPYSEREAAKSAGAKWDKAQKCWYADQNSDLQQLRQYLRTDAQQPAPTMSPREEFADVLRSLGATVDGDHPVMDGSKQRIKVTGDKGAEKSGMYVCHSDGHPAGYAINNRTQQEVRWKSKGYSLSDEERAALQAEAATKLAAREKAEAEQQQKVSQALTTLWEKCPPVPDNHQYLAAKEVGGQHLRLVPAGLELQTEPQILIGNDYKELKSLREKNPEAIIFTAGELLVPAQDVNGQIWQMQAIQPNGSKRFASGGRKDGNFCVAVGDAEQQPNVTALANADCIIVAEGYATAKTLAEVRGVPVIAAFDSGNLPAVAKVLRETYPDKPILIAGDDDKALEAKPPFINTGRVKSKAAAEAVGGHAVLPIFAMGEAEGQHGKALTDFNDLAKQSLLGEDGLKRQITAAVSLAISRQQEKTAVLDQQQELSQQQAPAIQADGLARRKSVGR